MPSETSTPPTAQAGPTSPTLLRANNPSHMTLTGTNTWLWHTPAHSLVAVDPGPLLADHQEKIRQAATTSAGTPKTEAASGLRAILLTHHHRDHSESVTQLQQEFGCEVITAPGTYNLDGLTVQAIATPGHTSDSVSFLFPDSGYCCTGDTVLGKGSTILIPPDGGFASHYQSLWTLSLLTPQVIHTVLPGHGPIRQDAAALLRAAIAHREYRIRALVSALSARDVTIPWESLQQPEALDLPEVTSVLSQLTQDLYPEVPATLTRATYSNMWAMLLFLAIVDPQTPTTMQEDADMGRFDGLKAGFDKFKDKAQEAADKITEEAQKISSNAKKSAEDTAEKAQDAADQVADSAENAADAVKDAVEDAEGTSE